MRDVLEQYLSVAGGYSYMGLFFVALLFLYIVFQKERSLWVYPNLLILLFIFNPILKKYMERYFLTGGVFWRMWWLMPIGLLIAAMFVRALDFIKRRNEKIFAILLICVIIILSGRFIFNEANFSRTENRFRILNDVLEVSAIIEHDSESQEKILYEQKIVAVYDVAWRIRQYNPRLRMLYGRRPGIDWEIFDLINNENVDYEKLDPLLRINDISYLVLNHASIDHLTENEIRPESFGYIMIGRTNLFAVYRTNIIMDITWKE